MNKGKTKQKKRVIVEYTKHTTMREFYNIPLLPRYTNFRIAAKIREALAHPLTWRELSTALALPINDLDKALNQLIREGFVGIHPTPDNQDVKFHWTQSAKGEAALRDSESKASARHMT